MLQKINDIINTSYEIVIPRASEELIGALIAKRARQTWYSFLIPGQIDFKEISINGDVIEIVRMPGTFSPFRSYGRIKFILQKTGKKDQTKIRCEVYPGNNSMAYVIAFQLFTTGFIALLFFLTGRDLATRVMGASVVVIIPGLITFFKYRSTKRDLIDYSRAIVKIMSN